MKIKTAIQILDEEYMKNPTTNGQHVFPAMKRYAEQFIDLAASRVEEYQEEMIYDIKKEIK